MRASETNTTPERADRAITPATSARLDLLSWTGSLGAITAEALAVRLGIGLPSARARLADARRRRLLLRERPLADAPALFALTAAGARACGSPGGACRIRPSNARHLVACAAVAATLERRYPGYRALGERELRRLERVHDRVLASARMAALHAGASALHRPDLVLVPRAIGQESPVAVEIELSVKAPRRLRAICRAWERCRAIAGVLYLVAPEVEPALARAVAATGASRIAVVPLAALSEPPTRRGSRRDSPRAGSRPKCGLACTSGRAETKEKTMSYTNINRVVLVGRLTAAPELRALPSGASVCSLRLACNGRRKGDDGEYTEKPNFFGVKVYGPQAEAVHRYMQRGRRVGVDGRLEWREWETAEGAKRQIVEIVADSVEFLDSGSAGPRDEDGGEAGGDAPLGRELVGVGTGIEDELEF